MVKTAMTDEKMTTTAFVCPNCGGNQLRGRYCAFCDSQILDQSVLNAAERADKQDSFDIPVGEYQGTNCNVVLGREEFTIRHFTFFESGNVCNLTIPYRKIVKLHYYRPKDKFATWGYIVVRWTENQHLPIPARKQCDALSHKQEQALICFSREDEPIFIHIFWLLQSQASGCVEFVIDDLDPIPAGVAPILQSINMDDYFQRHNPYRGNAVKELMRSTGLNAKKARTVVHNAFDSRQKELYRMDRELAVRDLNRLGRKAVKEGWSWVLDV